MLTGACLCGEVRYEVDGDLGEMANCHCSRCRKHSGAAFLTWVGVDADGFRFLRGADLLDGWESSPASHRRFCRRCGSTMPVEDPRGGKIYIPAGTFESDPGKKPVVHIFVGSKAHWVDIVDELPQFEEWPR